MLTILTEAPLLTLPDFSKDFIIVTDASGTALGAAVYQLINDDLKLITFASMHLSKAERRYSTTERELLPLVWSAKLFRHYIFGRKFKFITDHKPLVTLRKVKEKTGRIARLFAKLQEFDFDLEYVSGKSNVTADFLSRINENDEVPVKLINKSVWKSDWKWAEYQNEDKELSRIKELVEQNVNSHALWTMLVIDMR